MNPNDSGDLFARLEAGRQDLLASVDGMSDAEAAAHPAEDRWSALGIIEHLAIVETSMLRRIQEAALEDDPPPAREDALFKQVKDRTTRRQAPPQAQPTGEYKTLAEALQKFDAVRGRTLEFLRTNDRDLRRCTTVHPAFGTITGLDCLHMVAAHPSRHAAQIRELRGQSA